MEELLKMLQEVISENGGDDKEKCSRIAEDKVADHHRLSRLQKELNNLDEIDKRRGTDEEVKKPWQFSLYSDPESEYFTLLSNEKKLAILLMESGLWNTNKGPGFTIGMWTAEIINGIVHYWDGPAHRMMTRMAAQIIRLAGSYPKAVRLISLITNEMEFPTI